MKDIPKIPKAVLRRWTPQAKRCFENKCICENCDIPKIIETKCLMKYTVLRLFEKFGKPPEFINIPIKFRDSQTTKEPELSKEFILEQLHKGKTLKQIATDAGFPLGTISYWSNEIYCINARFERYYNGGKN